MVAAVGLGNVGNLPLVLVAALVQEAGSSLGEVGRGKGGGWGPGPGALGGNLPLVLVEALVQEAGSSLGEVGGPVAVSVPSQAERRLTGRPAVGALARVCRRGGEAACLPQARRRHSNPEPGPAVPPHLPISPPPQTRT